MHALNSNRCQVLSHTVVLIWVLASELVHWTKKDMNINCRWTCQVRARLLQHPSVTFCIGHLARFGVITTLSEIRSTPLSKASQAEQQQDIGRSTVQQTQRPQQNTRRCTLRVLGHRPFSHLPRSIACPAPCWSSLRQDGIPKALQPSVCLACGRVTH